jgi:hypothetical protein
LFQEFSDEFWVHFPSFLFHQNPKSTGTVFDSLGDDVAVPV